MQSYLCLWLIHKFQKKYNDCPNGIFRIFINRNICIETIPDNYYLDRTDNIYKECYNKCKKCNKEGTDANNNCDECIMVICFLTKHLQQYRIVMKYVIIYIIILF